MVQDIQALGFRDSPYQKLGATFKFSTFLHLSTFFGGRVDAQFNQNSVQFDTFHKLQDGRRHGPCNRHGEKLLGPASHSA